MNSKTTTMTLTPGIADDVFDRRRDDRSNGNRFL